MFKQLLDFLESTSLHGGRNIYNSRSKVRRVLWVVILLAAIGGCTYVSISMLMEVSNYSTQSVYKLQYKNALEFPTLTICSACPFDVEKLNASLFIIDIMWYISKWEALRQNVAPNIPISLNILEKIKKEMTIDIDSMFLQIRWNGKIYQPSSILKESETIDSMCWSFNGKDFQSENDAFVSLNSGFNAGLEVIADVRQSGCPGAYFYTAGLQIFIHSLHDKRPPRSPAAVLSPGTATNIGLSRTRKKFLPYPYKAYGDRYCTNQVNYSLSNCINTCIQKEIRDRCNCLPPITDDEDDILDFGELNSKCSAQDIVDSFVCYSDKIAKLTNIAEKGDICGCDDPCVLDMYETDLSFAYFPTDSASRRLVELGIIPDEAYARKNILKFNMNYKGLLQEFIDYVPVYNLEKILGIMGGHFGLFLGASVITAVEILELLLFFCWSIVTKKSRKKSTSSEVKPTQ